MNRETNTILSKTGGLGDLGLTITDLALAAKAEIEKIREQSLNLNDAPFSSSPRLGSGKSTLVRRLLQQDSKPHVLRFVYDAAAARAGKDGQDYHYVAARNSKRRMARERVSGIRRSVRQLLRDPPRDSGPGAEAGQGPGTRHRRARCETIEGRRFRKPLPIFILAPSRRSWSSGCARAAKIGKK